MDSHIFSRTELIIGPENLKKLHASKVAVFGVGGVGSFTVEALARAGLGNLVLVDYDKICESNINRQIHALNSTIGRAKVEVMKERILDINPHCKVETFQMLYNAETASQLLRNDYDYVVDAIDMVTAKIDLIVRCTQLNLQIISSMGAGNKLDPTKFQVTDIYNTSVCPLAKVMRRELRKRGITKLKVVYSPEEPIKHKLTNSENNQTRVPGSISFVPSVAGLIMASIVVRDLLENY